MCNKNHRAFESVKKKAVVHTHTDYIRLIFNGALNLEHDLVQINWFTTFSIYSVFPCQIT